MAMTVVPKTPTLAVYAGVLLTVAANELRVTGSAEQETTVTARLDVAGAQPGAAVIIPTHLAKYLKNLPDRTAVQVESDRKTRVYVTADGSAPYTFRTLDATFPTTQTGTPDRRPANLSRFGRALDAVAACARETKVVQVVSDDSGLRLHATDGKRLARAVLPEGGFGKFSGLVPLDALRSAAESGPQAVEVDRRGRIITFESRDARITTRLIDEVYPPVDAMLDDIPPRSATVPLGAFKAKLSRIESVAFAKRPLTVSMAGDELTLRMDSVDVGSGSETVELDRPAPAEISFAINPGYMSAALAAMSDEDAVTVAWTSPEQAVFLYTDGDMPVTVVIMPVRIA